MGSYLFYPFTSCEQCEPGTFTDSTTAFKCLPCPLGRATANTGMSECPVCPPGSYAPVEGMHHCKACPAGETNNMCVTPFRFNSYLKVIQLGAMHVLQILHTAHHLQ